MLKELTQAIMAKYATLQYNGSPLYTACELTADVGRNVQTGGSNGYPFACYLIVSDGIEYSSCSDIHSFVIQFSVFDNNPNQERILEISDIILDGFNMTSLSGLDGTLMKIEPINIIRRYISRQFGWQFMIDYRIQIEKMR